MSQYPNPPMTPPGYGAPPPPPPGGPYAGGPYGVPPGGGFGGQPKQSNGAAIGSLVCGILSFCIPVITGLLALILGFVGIRAARDPRVGGKGMAIAGIVLGLLGLAVQIGFASLFFGLMKGTDAQRALARQVITDLSAGNVDAAEANTDPTSGLDRDELDRLSNKMQGYGTLTDTTVMGFNATPGQTEVAVIAQYGTRQQQFQATVVKQPDGSYKVTNLRDQGP